MDLRADEVRARPSEGRLDPVERRRGQEDDVVGRRLRLRADRRADLLEERVGGGKVDHAVDLDLHRSAAHAADRDHVARHRVEVGGGLLGEQDAGASPGQHAQLAGERPRVSGRQAEHPSRPRALHRAACLRVEARGRSEPDGQRTPYPGLAANRGEHRRRVRIGLGFDLPVDRHARDGAGRHLRGRGREERADRGDQRHGQRDTGSRRQYATATVGEYSAQPDQSDHAGSSRAESRPLCISQRCARRSATAGSWVLTRSAAPV